MSDYATFNLIKTPTVDRLLKSNMEWVANNESSNMTNNLKEEMRCRGEVLDQELEEIQIIQSELLEMIERVGYNVEEIINNLKKVGR